MINYDGRHVFVEVRDYDVESLVDAAADLSNYCVSKGIVLVPRGPEFSDKEPHIIRWKIESMH